MAGRGVARGGLVATWPLRCLCHRCVRLGHALNDAVCGTLPASPPTPSHAFFPAPQAPEVLLSKEYDAKVDIFSLGMIMYCLFRCVGSMLLCLFRGGGGWGCSALPLGVGRDPQPPLSPVLATNPTAPPRSPANHPTVSGVLLAPWT